MNPPLNNKYYHDKTLTEVVEDQHLTAKRLEQKSRWSLRNLEERFNSEEYRELRERLSYASTYLNEVEDDFVEMSESERRIYEDANRCIEHACREFESAYNKMKVANDFMKTALDKSEIAFALARYKELRAANRIKSDEQNPSSKSCE